MKTDYTRKCGTCVHFERNGEYRHGWCHRFPYNENVVCDPRHPYPQRAMSARCAYYYDKRPTNANRIRAMTDEELATTIHAIRWGWTATWCDYHCENEGDDGCDKCVLAWLKQPAEVTT